MIHAAKAMDQATRDKIARDNAYHQAAMARRAEAFEQELEHRRLILGLERFHEFEMANIRKQNATVSRTEPSRTAQSKSGGKDVGTGIIRPQGPLFKQVAEDGSDIVEPLYLRVVWVDSDCGGLFRWTSERTEAAGGSKPDEVYANEEMEEAKESKTKNQTMQ